MMKTILYIDHSESWTYLLREELSEEGYQVLLAESIGEALSKWKEIELDLIILELRQERFNEEDFKRMKRRYLDIPWIGFSTFPQCPLEYQKWVHYYMEKSSQTDSLKKLIGDLQEGHPTLYPTIRDCKTNLFDGRSGLEKGGKKGWNGWL